MKKIMFFVLCFSLIIIAGCKSSVITENNTTKKQETSVESINNTSNTRISENKGIAFTQTEAHSKTSYITTSSESSEQYDYSPATNTLQFDIKTLKALKKAAETMSDEEFESYLEENRLELAWFEMVNTTEKFNSLLDDIKNIHIAVLDENSDNISLTYYVTEKRLFQSVPFSETRRFAFDFYVDNEPFYYATMEDAEHVKTVNTDFVKANVYVLENKSGFCANANLDTQKFCIRVSETQTIEEFEEDFKRFEFVQIRDLLN